jgi:hypothetical protein
MQDINAVRSFNHERTIDSVIPPMTCIILHRGGALKDVKIIKILMVIPQSICMIMTTILLLMSVLADLHLVVKGLQLLCMLVFHGMLQ